MSLPKWIQDAKDEVGTNRWTKALTIAWEALGKLNICDCRDGYGRPRKHVKTCASVICKEALRRFEELGND